MPILVGLMLRISGLKKGFVTPEGGRVTVVAVDAFGLGTGEQVALRGESGSGKTTFLNLIAGILAADEGQISVAGVEMTDLSEAQRDRRRAKSIGYIFQTFNLLQGYT